MKRFALLLVVAPLALAACGGSSATAPKSDPVAYVTQSAKTTAALTSEHMTMTGNISVGSINLTMTGSGDFANATKKGQMVVVAGLSAAGRNLHIHEVLDGTTIYLRSPAYDSQLPAGKTWMKLDLQKAGASKGINYSSLMSQSPARSLLQLEAAGTVKSIGAETIDGVYTTHYQVTNLDISKLPQGANIQALAHPTYGPVDVWIGNKDGYVHRESLSFTHSVAGNSASMAMRIDLSKFGEKVNVTVPPARQVFDYTQGMGG